MIACDTVNSENILQQVLSRIHRYGQKHEQHVTFLTVRGSFNKLLHGRYVGGWLFLYKKEHMAWLPLATALRRVLSAWVMRVSGDVLPAQRVSACHALSRIGAGIRLAGIEAQCNNMLQLFPPRLVCHSMHFQPHLLSLQYCRSTKYLHRFSVGE